MAVKLAESNLPRVPDRVVKPTYDRSALTPGIVHIGVGNFHRAHQAVYLDALFGMGLDHDWGVIGAGVRPADKRMRSNLSAQDWLTTVVELGAAGPTARIAGCMIDFVAPGADGLVARLAMPDIRIVSLTITEGGYYIDATTGAFAIDHAEIVADIENPSSPATVFGIIVAALRRRRQAGAGAFTIMSCDNLPQNGHAARDAVVGLASAMSPDLGAWIADRCAFPNSMVDCITPATGARERALVNDVFGIEDAAPVVCEPFRQWVVEDAFVSGRPALEKVGVEFVEDVAPHELMKLRILNGGHAAIAYPAALLGIDLVVDAMADRLVRGFLCKVERDEIMPTLPAIEGVDFDRYFSTVEQRFSNGAMGDTIARLCRDGSNRQPKFILPTITDRIASGLPTLGLALEVALWCRYCAGADENGRGLAVVDPIAERLGSLARRARVDPDEFLKLDTVFGPLGRSPVFEAAFTDALRALWEKGVAATLEAYLDDERALADP